MDDQQLRLQSIFAPRSVAVVGASTRPDSVGRAAFSNILLHGYTGVVYPVNPKAMSILAVKAYPSVLEIPEEVDLAVIVVPSVIIPTVLEEGGQRGIRGRGLSTFGSSSAKCPMTTYSVTDSR
jgi:acetate---CoA ligase (ADP-forming)